MLLLSEESKVFKSLNVFRIFVGLQNGIHLSNAFHLLRYCLFNFSLYILA